MTLFYIIYILLYYIFYYNKLCLVILFPLVLTDSVFFLVTLVIFLVVNSFQFTLLNLCFFLITGTSQ